MLLQQSRRLGVVFRFSPNKNKQKKTIHGCTQNTLLHTLHTWWERWNKKGNLRKKNKKKIQTRSLLFTFSLTLHVPYTYTHTRTRFGWSTTLQTADDRVCECVYVYLRACLLIFKCLNGGVKTRFSLACVVWWWCLDFREDEFFCFFFIRWKSWCLLCTWLSSIRVEDFGYKREGWRREGVGGADHFTVAW